MQSNVSSECNMREWTPCSWLWMFCSLLFIFTEILEKYLKSCYKRSWSTKPNTNQHIFQHRWFVCSITMRRHTKSRTEWPFPHVFYSPEPQLIRPAVPCWPLKDVPSPHCWGAACPGYERWNASAERSRWREADKSDGRGEKVGWMWAQSDGWAGGKRGGGKSLTYLKQRPEELWELVFSSASVHTVLATDLKLQLGQKKKGEYSGWQLR